MCLNWRLNDWRRRGLHLHHWRRLVVILLGLGWADWKGGPRCSRLILNRCYWLRLGSFPYLLLLINLSPLFLTDRSFCCFVVAEVRNDCWAWLSYLLRGLLQLRLLYTLIVQVVVSTRVLVRISSLLCLTKSILIDGVLTLWGALFLRQNTLYFERFFGRFYWESINSDEFLMCPVNSFTNQGQRSVQTLAVTCAKTSKFKGKRCWVWAALQTSRDLSDHSSKVYILIENSSIDTRLVHRQFIENEMLEQTHLSHLNLLNILGLLDLVISSHPPDV